LQVPIGERSWWAVLNIVQVSDVNACDGGGLDELGQFANEDSSSFLAFSPARVQHGHYQQYSR